MCVRHTSIHDKPPCLLLSFKDVTYAHTRIHTHKHTNTQTHTHTQKTHKHTNTQTHKHTNKLTHCCLYFCSFGGNIFVQDQVLQFCTTPLMLCFPLRAVVCTARPGMQQHLCLTAQNYSNTTPPRLPALHSALMLLTAQQLFLRAQDKQSATPLHLAAFTLWPVAVNCTARAKTIAALVPPCTGPTKYYPPAPCCLCPLL